MGQSASLTCPNTSSSITLGSGGVDGICATSDGTEFFQAGSELILEAKADMRLVTDAGLGAAAKSGVLIGTPATIQHSAGGGIQIYAGAGVSAATGAPGGPGEPFKASDAPKVEAGKAADSACNWQDGIKGVGAVVGGGLDAKDAWNSGNKAEAAKQAFSAAKGAWDASKAAGAKSDGLDTAFGDASSGLVDTAAAAVSGDIAGLAAGAAAVLGGTMAGTAAVVQKSKQAQIKAEYDEAVLRAKAAAEGSSNACGTGGGLGMPVDGPRIHEVAPANIDRECGADLTAKVGGNKTALVDGSIEYKAGASIAMKAGNKIETTSLMFEAHANVTATVRGLAVAKMESLGSASVDGKAKFKVSTMGAGTVDAKGKLTLKAGGNLDMLAGGVMTIKAGGPAVFQASSIGLTGKGRVSVKAPTIQLKGQTTIDKDTTVKGVFRSMRNATIKGQIIGMDGARIKGNCKLG